MKKLLLLVFFCCISMTAQETIEGFREASNGDYYFYETDGNVLKEPVWLDFTSAPEAYELLNSDESYMDYFMKISGARVSGGRFGELAVSGKIVIERIIETDKDYWMYKFVQKNRTFIEKIEKVTLEGFHFKALEASYFWPLKDGELTGEQAWTMFDKSLQKIDSLRSVSSFYAPGFGRGVYMKIEGIRKSGVSLRYGHLSGVSSQIDVVKIITVDTLRTAFGFIADKLNKDKYLVWEGDTLRAPNRFRIGETRTYTGQAEKYNVEMVLKRINETDIEYELKYLKKNRIKKMLSGKLFLDIRHFLYNIKDIPWTDEPIYSYNTDDDEHSRDNTLTLSLYKDTRDLKAFHSVRLSGKHRYMEIDFHEGMNR